MHDRLIDRQLDFRLLTLLLTLYEERSVTAAAKKLGMSQPAFSKALSRLRKLLRDDLFVKVGYGMVPTPRVNSLIEPAREVVMRLQRQILAQPDFDAAIGNGKFTFALTELGEMCCFPKILKALRSISPRATARSVSPPDRELLYGLETGEIDIAVGFFPELERNSIFQQRLLRIRAVCLLRADHPIKGAELSLDQYLALGHINVSGPRGGGATLERSLRRQPWRENRKVEVVATCFASLPSILQQSDLAATVWQPPAINFCSSNQNLKIMELPFSATADFVQHWHARYQNDDRNRWIRRLVKSVVKT
jgi:DNA-binding transcriptional LysR family regulator